MTVSEMADPCHANSILFLGVRINKQRCITSRIYGYNVKVDLKKRNVRLLIRFICFRVELSCGFKADMVLQMGIQLKREIS